MIHIKNTVFCRLFPNDPSVSQERGTLRKIGLGCAARFPNPYHIYDQQQQQYHSNELYLHGHKRELQHCESTLKQKKIVIKVNQITTLFMT